MRAGPGVALGLAIFCSACKPASRADMERPVATVAMTSSAARGCEARWNGVVVSQQAIVEYGIAALERALLRAGGGDAMITHEALPLVRVEAAPAIAYACVGATLRSLQQAGFPYALLRPAGGRDTRVDFFLEYVSDPINGDTMIEVGRGSLGWNGTATDLAGIRGHVQAMPQPPLTGTPPSLMVGTALDQLAVRVAPDASFGELQALLATLAEMEQTAILMSCAGPFGPPGVARPPC
ncbi:MAG TPA: hypothetical protein VGW40_12050 [Allosphingosinicella sp.]|nr:hypothetical protein [Allosphingosinicella sp.]